MIKFEEIYLSNEKSSHGNFPFGASTTSNKGQLKGQQVVLESAQGPADQGISYDGQVTNPIGKKKQGQKGHYQAVLTDNLLEIYSKVKETF